jgi:hypothetical protein
MDAIGFNDGERAGAGLVAIAKRQSKSSRTLKNAQNYFVCHLLFFFLAESALGKTFLLPTLGEAD